MTSQPPPNSTARFADRAGDYAKARPTYPAALLDALLAPLAHPSALVAADVGAGTGVFSRLLAERGVRTIAVEPNAPMRAATAAHPLIEWRDGTGEASGLPERSLDLLTVAQAFHWMRTEDALREFHRVLKPGGVLALVWNTQDRSDAFTNGYCDVMERHAVDPPRSPWALGDVSRVLDDHPLFTARVVQRFTHAQDLDLEALFARARSASYCPKEGPGWEGVSRDLRQLHSLHTTTGVVRLRYLAELHTSKSCATQSRP